MTAVAPPPNLQGLNRSAWAGNGASNGLHTMSADDVSRMLMPRKPPAQRSNSSSSLSSLSSNSSTISAASSTNSNASAATNGDAARKRPPRYLWPNSKAEPTAGLSTARPQSIASASSGTSASAAISALHAPSPTLNSTNNTMTQQNGAMRGSLPTEGTAVLYLTPINGTFERKTISVPFYPDVIRIGRQTNAKTIPTPMNGFFDSKVLSRAHAEVWADRNGKIWIRDIKSSNGTFVNGQRLSQENKDSDPHELREQDMLELGIDIVSEDQKHVVHHKVAARVEHAGFLTSNSLLELNFGEMDPSGSGMQMGNPGMGQHMRRGSNQSVNGNNMRPGMAPPANNMMQQRPQHVWLAPINMEQVIKRLSTEYKAAKQQQFDLQRTSQFLDTLLTSDQHQRKDSSTGIPLPLDAFKGKSSNAEAAMKARFSDPPNPPPQAPLPDKPLEALDSPFRKKSNIELPKPTNGVQMTNGPVKSPDVSSNSQIESLSEALRLAKKEFDSQSKRLREMEELLVQERVKREFAEDRAKKLEKEQGGEVDALNRGPIQVKIPNGAPGQPDQSPTEKPSTPIEEEANSEIGRKGADRDTVAKKLQQRLEQLLADFQEVKAESEKWRQEKEKAEQERDEARKEKLSLMEMVESIRREKQAVQQRTDAKKRDSKVDELHEDLAPLKEALDSALEDRDQGTARPGNISKALFANGHLKNTLRGTGGGTFAKPDHHQLAQAAPYISAMSVVIIGVAVMAVLNKMSRGER